MTTPSASADWLFGGRRIKVVVGHYGSGKTEIAVNMAMRLASRAAMPNDRTSRAGAMLIDLDIVNPFFRSAEVKPILESRGVEVIHPAFALTGVDIPVLPAEVERAFTTDRFAVFDVGGDDDGAAALGRYHARFQACPADVFFVVNPFRPRSSEVSQALELMELVARCARIPVTGLVVNANLGSETRPENLLAGRAFVEDVSKESGVPVAFEAGLPEALEGVPFKYPRLAIERFLKPEWMD